MEAINIYSEKKLKINLSIHKVLISSLADVYNSNLKRKVTKENKRKSVISVKPL